MSLREAELSLVTKESRSITNKHQDPVAPPTLITSLIKMWSPWSRREAGVSSTMDTWFVAVSISGRSQESVPGGQGAEEGGSELAGLRVKVATGRREGRVSQRV